mgnify:CR=1 FL=1
MQLSGGARDVRTLPLPASECPNQSSEVDLSPRLRDLSTLDAVDDQTSEFYRTSSRIHPFEPAAMGRSGCRPKHHSVAFGNQIINGMVGIGKGFDKLPFKAFQFVSAHRRGAQVANVIGGNEVIEFPSKAGIREGDPATNEILVLCKIHWHDDVCGLFRNRGVIAGPCVRLYRGDTVRAILSPHKARLSTR